MTTDASEDTQDHVLDATLALMKARPEIAVRMNVRAFKDRLLEFVERELALARRQAEED